MLGGCGRANRGTSPSPCQEKHRKISFMKTKILSLHSKCRDRKYSCGATWLNAFFAFSLRIHSIKICRLFVTGSRTPASILGTSPFRSPSEVHSVKYDPLPSHRRQLSGGRLIRLTYSSSSVCNILPHFLRFVKGISEKNSVF